MDEQSRIVAAEISAIHFALGALVGVLHRNETMNGDIYGAILNHCAAGAEPPEMGDALRRLMAVVEAACHGKPPPVRPDLRLV
jgi:hypothetical protein